VSREPSIVCLNVGKDPAYSPTTVHSPEAAGGSVFRLGKRNPTGKNCATTFVEILTGRRPEPIVTAPGGDYRLPSCQLSYNTIAIVEIMIESSIHFGGKRMSDLVMISAKAIVAAV
jgi:hypothetical protein